MTYLIFVAAETSFILMTSMRDSEVILKGEIRYQSL